MRASGRHYRWKNLPICIGAFVLLAGLVLSIWLAWRVLSHHLDVNEASAYGELLLVAVLSVEGVVAVAGFAHADEDRRRENMVAVIEQIAEHNREIARNPNYRAVVGRLLGHVLPTTAAAIDEYWASRLLHLSHINLLWQVWELNGGSYIAEHAGWRRFAAHLAKHLTSGDASSAIPEEQARHDLWKELDNGIWPDVFVHWLKGLSSRPV